MELSNEFVEKNQLSEEQVTAITTEANAQEATLKHEWDGKANTNAEAIIDGALAKTVELTGIARNDGEKSADYLSRANGLYFEGTKSTLAAKQTQLDDLIKNGKPNELLQSNFDEMKGKYDALQQKEAIFADWEKNDYKGKYEQANEQLNNQTKDIAFNSVKPAFPDTINSYEAKGRWNEFERKTLDKYSIQKVDDDWIGVDKENEYKTIKLEDLVKADESLSNLLQGRQQKGIGSQSKDIKIEGVPFNVPEGATPTERQKAVKDYLASQNISPTSAEYSKQFASLNAKILEKNPTKK